MSVFADSSALVKLYADEPGHREVRSLSEILVSALVRVEVPAAIWRKQRIGELSAESAAVLVAEFVADYQGTATEAPRFAPIAITGAVLDDAAHLCAVHGLRAYDAVQLASARAAASADHSCRSFAAFDLVLRAAAAVEGFTPVPAEFSG